MTPAQGPITVFIHHNTLHAFDHLPFTEGVERGAEVFGCQPYLTEDRYRDEIARGRTRPGDLRAVLADDLGGRAGDPVLRFGTRLDLRLAMLTHPVRSAPTDELSWFAADTDAHRKVRPDVDAAARGRLLDETRR